MGMTHESHCDYTQVWDRYKKTEIKSEEQMPHNQS